MRLGDGTLESTGLFEAQERGTVLDRFFAQSAEVIGRLDGASCAVVGRIPGGTEVVERANLRLHRAGVITPLVTG